MNKSISIFTSIIVSLVVCVTCLCLNTKTVLAHRPHDHVYTVELSSNYQQDQTLFTIVRGNLLKSIDGGNSWQRLTNGINNRGKVSNLTIPSQNAQVLYISSLGDGIYKSQNGGNSWFKVNQGLDNFELELLITDTEGKRVLAAGKEQGLYLSEDGGSNWHTILADRKITALYFPLGQSSQILVGDRQGILYLSPDNGKTWQQKIAIGKGSAINAIAFSTDHQIIYVGTVKEGLWQSTDQGQNFTPLNQNNAPINIQDIVTSEDNSTLWVSERNEGVFAFNNGSWTKLSQGLTKSEQADAKNFQQPHFSDLAISPDFSEDKTLFLAGFNGLFKTSDGGNQWQELDALSARIVVGLAISPNYAQDSTLAVVNYIGEAYISRDRGLTWQPMYKGIEIPRFTKSWQIPGDDPRRFFDIAFSPNYSNDGHLFIGTLRNYFLKGNDRGAKWQVINLPRAPGYIRGNMVLVSPNFAQDSTVFLSTNQGHLYHSLDRGHKFSLVGKVGQRISSLVISPNFANDYTFYASSGDKIYKSINGGQTWHNIIDRPNFQEFWLKLAISPEYSADTTLFAGTDLYLYKTEDGGDVWRKIPPANYGGGGIFEAIALSPNYAQDHTLIVSIKGKGAWKSTDEGESFTPVGKLDNYLLPFSHVSGVHAAPTTIQFSPNYKNDLTLYGFGLPKASVLKSTDGGKTWQEIAIPQAAIFAAYQNNQYDLLTSLSLQMLIYRRQIAQFLLAAIAGLFSYWLVGKLKIDKTIPLNKYVVKIAGSLLGVVIAWFGFVLLT